MMNAPDPERAPGWTFYFAVDGIDSAAERVRAAGGEVTMGPMQVPDGSFVVHARDPEGNAFALVSAAL
jgi:hypothetical protein